ncbi:hypothetical protein [Glycomyces sp. NRRL B-16210]|uniref:hypothetical protein n=1 Tax=Glycomyces sp. NRRL B-16210 TaxID=1463821 RepID=UPI0004C135F2|nr:hypothetical protein [Glycomyces sp. NRRL B-16210]
MTPPENDRPDDEDGGTFKLKPGGAPGAGAPGPAAPAAGPGDEDNLDRTMKIQRGAVPPAPTTPPPPASPLGNPTGPAEPPAAAFAETTVMPQQSGSQTGFQPTGQQASQPPQGPLGPTPQSPGPQQPYGQPGPQQGQPGGYPPPPQQQQPGYPQPQTAPAAGEAPEGVKRIGLMAIVGSGIGLLTSIIVLAVLGGFAIVTAPLSILFALALGWYGYALPRGQITSNGLRLTGIILMMIAAGSAVLGLFSSFNTIAVFGGLGVISLVQSILLAGAYGYASFIYIKDDASKAYIKGTPAGPGYPQQAGYPQQGQQPYGQQGQPGGYPPPPPGYPQQGQQPPQGPYGR